MNDKLTALKLEHCARMFGVLTLPEIRGLLDYNIGNLRYTGLGDPSYERLRHEFDGLLTYSGLLARQLVLPMEEMAIVIDAGFAWLNAENRKLVQEIAEVSGCEYDPQQYDDAFRYGVSNTICDKIILLPKSKEAADAAIEFFRVYEPRYRGFKIDLYPRSVLMGWSGK